MQHRPPRRGERIYHLPFDQQYDTTLIEPARGERYAACGRGRSLGLPACVAMEARAECHFLIRVEPTVWSWDFPGPALGASSGPPRVEQQAALLLCMKSSSGG